MNRTKKLRHPGHSVAVLSLWALVALAAGCADDGGDPATPGDECPAGTALCPCGPGSACGSTSDGLPLVCTDSICVEDACIVGELYCGCDEGACAEGACRDGVCLPPGGLTLTPSDPAARACDVLVDAGGRLIGTARILDAAIGATEIRGARAGVSFARRIDAAFMGASAVVVLDGADAVSAASVTLKQVQCFDRLGRAIAGATVEVH